TDRHHKSGQRGRKTGILHEPERLQHGQCLRGLSRGNPHGLRPGGAVREFGGHILGPGRGPDRHGHPPPPKSNGKTTREQGLSNLTAPTLGTWIGTTPGDRGRGKNVPLIFYLHAMTWHTKTQSPRGHSSHTCPSSSPWDSMPRNCPQSRTIPQRSTKGNTRTGRFPNPLPKKCTLPITPAFWSSTGTN